MAAKTISVRYILFLIGSPLVMPAGFAAPPAGSVLIILCYSVGTVRAIRTLSGESPEPVFTVAAT
jgi:hypothetical protein